MIVNTSNEEWPWGPQWDYLRRPEVAALLAGMAVDEERLLLPKELPPLGVDRFRIFRSDIRLVRPQKKWLNEPKDGKGYGPRAGGGNGFGHCAEPALVEVDAENLDADWYDFNAYGGVEIVSQKWVDLVSSFDRDAFEILPAILKLKNGCTIENEWFLFDVTRQEYVPDLTRSVLSLKKLGPTHTVEGIGVLPTLIPYELRKLQYFTTRRDLPQEWHICSWWPRVYNFCSVALFEAIVAAKLTGIEFCDPADFPHFGYLENGEWVPPRPLGRRVQHNGVRVL